VQILTPTEMVSTLNAYGCAIDSEAYQKFCLLLSTVPHQGTVDRGAESDAQGRLVLPINPVTGKPLQQDRDHDPADVKRQRLLRSSLERHLNACHCVNGWAFQE